MSASTYVSDSNPPGEERKGKRVREGRSEGMDNGDPGSQGTSTSCPRPLVSTSEYSLVERKTESGSGQIGPSD